MSQEEQEEKETTDEAPRAEQEEPAEVIDATAAAEPVLEGHAESVDRPDRARAEAPERRRRHFGRRKVCAFCVENVRVIDYKDPVKLRRYLSDRGRIEARRKTGTCAKHQRWLALALKRARHLALLPYTPEHIRATGVFAARR